MFFTLKLSSLSFISLKKSEIIVIRISNDPKIHHYLESRPCSECIKMLKKLRIKNVYYSNFNGEIIKESVKIMKPTHITHGNCYLLDKK